MALRGVKVLELAGLAPGPFCGMVLSDFGARVVRLDKPDSPWAAMDRSARGKRSLAIDLKKKDGPVVLKKLCRSYDVLIEPFRAGVMEKLGLGPDVLLEENPKLIYARLTGYGQSGSYAQKAGHDINYLSMSGVLSRLGRKEEAPLPPVNLLADFAGGGLTCALGVMAALVERGHTGRGQVIDANMVEGAAYVSSWMFRAQDMLPIWGKGRGENALDSGSHYYETYKCKDGKYMAVGALEPQFYAQLLQGLGWTESDLAQFGASDALKAKLKAKFLTRTRSEWTSIFESLDACVTPVLDVEEAAEHPHNCGKGTFTRNARGNVDVIPAPRLSNHAAELTSIPGRADPRAGQHTRLVLEEAGFSTKEIEHHLRDGVVVQAEEKISSKL